jgi:hypothetical protein
VTAISSATARFANAALFRVRHVDRIDPDAERADDLEVRAGIDQRRVHAAASAFVMAARGYATDAGADVLQEGLRIVCLVELVQRVFRFQSPHDMRHLQPRYENVRLHAHS